MKGHMQDGKFHPHTDYKKVSRKKREPFPVTKDGVKISQKELIQMQRADVGRRRRTLTIPKLTVLEGKEIAEEQIDRLAGGFREPNISDKRIGFVIEANRLLKKGLKTSKTGYDVPRGRDIDLIWMKYEYNVPMKRAMKLYDWRNP